MERSLRPGGRRLSALRDIVEDRLGREVFRRVGKDDSDFRRIGASCLKGWVTNDFTDCAGDTKGPGAFVCVGLRAS